MFGNIKVGIVAEDLSVVNKNKITAGQLIRRLKKSVYESAGVCEIRLRLFLWELSGKARQKIAGYGLNSTMTGKTVFLFAACCLFVAAGILMVWQSHNGVGQQVQTVNAAGSESFNLTGHTWPVSKDRSRLAGSNGFELSRDSGRMVPPKPEMNPHRFLAKNEIKAHPRIVFSCRD